MSWRFTRPSFTAAAGAGKPTSGAPGVVESGAKFNAVMSLEVANLLLKILGYQ